MQPHVANGLRFLHVECDRFATLRTVGTPASIKSAVDSVLCEIILPGLFAAGLCRFIEDVISFAAASLRQHGRVLFNLHRNQRTQFFVDCFRCRREILLRIAANRPKKSASHHVQIRRFHHRFVVMSDGRREDSSAAIIVRPDADLRLIVILAIGDG